MKVLAIAGTKRKNGLVSSMCQRILDGAIDNGHETEMINLYDYNINYCVGCWNCSKLGKCFQEDDFEIILDKVKEADVIILGSPVYWSDVSAILKNFFDRHTGYAMYLPSKANEYHKLPKWTKFKTLISVAKKFGAKKKFANKKFVLVTACTSPFPVSHITKEIPQTLYVLKMYAKKLKGKIIAKLVYTDTLFRFWNKEEKVMKKAYEIGRKLK